MNRYRADLHVHTVLSPCGDLAMSPANIVEVAAHKGIDILGITDHNSTRHGSLIKKMAEKEGIYVLRGAEVTTREEIHCLAFFESDEHLEVFQKYLDTFLGDVWNIPDKFGYQVVVDEEEIIVEEVDKLLVSAIHQSIDEVEKQVRQLDGLFIPAHIDRPFHSLISQLGFVPEDLNADALELSRHSTQEDLLRRFPGLKSFTFIQSSDAHQLAQLGTRTTLFEIEQPGFNEIRLALAGERGRKVHLE